MLACDMADVSADSMSIIFSMEDRSGELGRAVVAFDTSHLVICRTRNSTRSTIALKSAYNTSNKSYTSDPQDDDDRHDDTFGGTTAHLTAGNHKGFGRVRGCTFSICSFVFSSRSPSAYLIKP